MRWSGASSRAVPLRGNKLKDKPGQGAYRSIGRILDLSLPGWLVPTELTPTLEECETQEDLEELLSSYSGKCLETARWILEISTKLKELRGDLAEPSGPAIFDDDPPHKPLSDDEKQGGSKPILHRKGAKLTYPPQLVNNQWRKTEEWKLWDYHKTVTLDNTLKELYKKELTGGQITGAQRKALRVPLNDPWVLKNIQLRKRAFLRRDEIRKLYTSAL